jgi:hypothetical protein
MCSTSFLAPMCLFLCFSLCFLTPTTIRHHSCHSTQHLLLSHIYVVLLNILFHPKPPPPPPSHKTPFDTLAIDIVLLCESSKWSQARK